MSGPALNVGMITLIGILVVPIVAKSTGSKSLNFSIEFIDLFY